MQQMFRFRTGKPPLAPFELNWLPTLYIMLMLNTYTEANFRSCIHDLRIFGYLCGNWYVSSSLYCKAFDPRNRQKTRRFLADFRNCCRNFFREPIYVYGSPTHIYHAKIMANGVFILIRDSFLFR